jgi:hypothetical protein
MAVLPLRSISLLGADPQLQAAAVGGDTFANTDAYLLVRNTDTVAHTVTIASQATPSPGIAAANVAVPVPAGATRMIGPFGGANSSVLANAGGTVSLTYDAVTGVTIALVK